MTLQLGPHRTPGFDKCRFVLGRLEKPQDGLDVPKIVGAKLLVQLQLQLFARATEVPQLLPGGGCLDNVGEEVATAGEHVEAKLHVRIGEFGGRFQIRLITRSAATVAKAEDDDARDGHDQSLVIVPGVRVDRGFTSGDRGIAKQGRPRDPIGDTIDERHGAAGLGRPATRKGDAQRDQCGPAQ